MSKPDDMAWSEWWQQALAAIQKHADPTTTSGEKIMRTAHAAGDFPRIDPEEPEAGYYKTRVEPRSPIFMPVRMYYVLRCEVGRYHTSPYTEWLHCCKFPISKAEWEDMKGIKPMLKTEGGVYARV